MSINYQFGDVDAHGALIRAQAASLEAEHQAIIRDVLSAGAFWGGSGWAAYQEVITKVGANFQGLCVRLEAALHRPHFVRVGHKTCCHLGCRLS